jgi:hypothetical protein
MKKILRDFKMRLQLMKVNHRTYVCDPMRAIKCGKEACWEINKGPCKCTAKRKYAKRDINGKPVIAKDEDLYNEDYLDYIVSIQLTEEAPDIHDGVVN